MEIIKKAAIIEQPREILSDLIIPLNKEIEQLRSYFDVDVTLIRLKGYSPLNRKMQYQDAKIPIDAGWNSTDFQKKSSHELNEWIEKDGWLGIVIPTGFIVVDIDDKCQGDLLSRLLNIQKIGHLAISTPNGFQFIFRDAGVVQRQGVKVLTDAGFVVDYRLANKGQIVLPLDNKTQDRFWCITDQPLSLMPHWLAPLKSVTNDDERSFNLPVIEGSRNANLFSHGCRLRQLGRSAEIIQATILLLGQHLCNPPLDEGELHTIVSSIHRYDTDLSDKTPNIQQKPQDEWIQPTSLLHSILPDFPTHIFPNWLREFIQCVSIETQTPIDAASMAALSALSTVNAKKFIVTSPWKEKNNLYSMVVLPPGEKKSVIHRLFTEIITDYEKAEIERARPAYIQAKAELKVLKRVSEEMEKKYAKSRDPAILEEIKRLAEEIHQFESISLPRYVTSDITPEKLVGLLVENSGRMAILSAESGIFDIIAGRYSKNGKANMDIFLNSYTGDYTSVDRMGRNESVPDPTLTIGLFVQPDVLREIPDGFEKRGLLGRFLYSLPQSNVGHRNMNPPSVPHEHLERYNRLMLKLLQFRPSTPLEFTMDTQTLALFNDFRQRIERRLRQDGDLSADALKAWANKFPGHLLRIASLLHVAYEVERLNDFSELTITKVFPFELFKVLIASCEYFIDHTKAAFGYMRTDKASEDAMYIISRIQVDGRGCYSHQELKRLVHGKLKSANEMNNAFRLVEEYGYIRSKLTNLEGKGRTGNEYLVNPFILNAQ